MADFDAEAHVYDYIVYVYLIKALDRDRKVLRQLKLARAWEGLAEALLTRLAEEMTIHRRRMARHGLRIVLEEIVPGNNVHVMYTYRRYEYHCYMLPYVLKSRCEDKLLQLMQDMHLTEG